MRRVEGPLGVESHRSLPTPDLNLDSSNSRVIQHSVTIPIEGSQTDTAQPIGYVEVLSCNRETFYI